MIINIDGKDFSGSGVLIIEKYIKNKNKIPSIVLVRNNSSKLFSDFGGTHEKKHKTLETTASNELNEESRNLIDINPKILSKKEYIDIIANKKRNIYYRIYIVRVDGICRKYYHHNKEVIDDSDAKKYFKETDDITHIPLDNINFDNIKNLSGSIKDIYDNDIKLNMRVRNILSNAHDTIVSVMKSDALANQSDFDLKKDLFHKKTYILSIE